ncbi:hypothetical protein BH10BAC4_BH10BAC4_15460 [soil metagenome]
MNASPQQNQNPIFKKGEPTPTDYFTGTAWLNTLVAKDDVFNVVIGNVVFEPGARNNWHKHPGGQILIVTNGTGYYQEQGQAIRLLNNGDVIRIPPEIIHWHGASHDNAMTHIAISTNTQNGIVDWLKRVTDEEYNGYKR